jgi:radical SAM-linked protein
MAAAPAQPPTPTPAASESSPAPAASPRFRVAIEFAITGDLRFLAHHDELRLLTRALVRSGWPLAYSHGFNPRPRLTVPLPRNLGTAAMCQVALVELREPRRPDELRASLAAQLPAGCELLGVIAPAPAATPHPQGVTYELDLSAEHADGLVPRLQQLLTRESVPIQRDAGPEKPGVLIDIRPYIDQLELNGRRLRFVLRFAEQRTARPSEVITELGLPAADYNHRLRRVAVQWDMELTGPIDGPATRERNCIGNEEDNVQEGNETRAEGDRGR